MALNIIDDGTPFYQGKSDIQKFTEIQTQFNSLQTDVTDSTFTTETISITSGQTATLGTPLELLPVPGSNKYYEIQRVTIESSDDVTGFSLVGTDFLYFGFFTSASYMGVHKLIIGGGGTAYVMSTAFGEALYDDVNVINMATPMRVNEAFSIGTWSGDNPTGGGALSLKVKITYKIQTLG